jgi:hypothetical protein
MRSVTKWYRKRKLFIFLRRPWRTRSGRSRAICPTQAKGRLEWGTQHLLPVWQKLDPSGSHADTKARPFLDCSGYGFPQFPVRGYLERSAAAVFSRGKPHEVPRLIRPTQRSDYVRAEARTLQRRRPLFLELWSTEFAVLSVQPRILGSKIDRSAVQS